jgi:hypothetical protein
MHNGPDLFAHSRQGVQLKTLPRKAPALNKTTVKDGLHRKRFSDWTVDTVPAH